MVKLIVKVIIISFIGLFHANGFNSLGIQLSGGAGEQIAAWIALGRPEIPLHAYDIRRFTPVQRQDRAWVTETSHECYAKTYSITYPFDQPLAGRNHKTDSFHEVSILHLIISLLLIMPF